MGVADHEWNRLFIKVDPDSPSGESASWVQLTLTPELLERLGQLSVLVAAYHLTSVTSEIDATWQFAPGCSEYERYLSVTSWVELWADGFTVKCFLERANGDDLVFKIVEATCICGGVAEFVEAHRRECGDEQWDDLQTDVGWNTPVPGEPDELIEFSKLVDEHLLQSGYMRLNPPTICGCIPPPGQN